jgi:hypothetical protein
MQPVTRTRSATAAALLVAATATAGAQSLELSILALEGDFVEDVGLITRFDNLAVNNDGSWLTEADTDHPDTDADVVLLRDGSLYLREGQPLPVPAGATVDSFDTVLLSNNGHSAWNFFLGDTGSTSNDSGIYYDTTLIIQESDLATAAAFSAGTPYIGFFETKFNDADQILVMASVDDPEIASTVDRALVIVDYDPATGAAPQRVLYKEGDILPGQIEPVGDFETGPHDFDFNNAGQTLFIADLTGPTDVDGALYLDDTLLAQEGSPSPVLGRNWLSFGSAVVALSNGGGWAVRAQLDGDTGSDIVIVRGSDIIAQEGSPVPGVAGATFTTFGSAPIGIDDLGRVYWYGGWSGGEAIFRDDEPILVAGETIVEGRTVTDVFSVQDALAASDNGRFLVAEVAVDAGPDAAILVEFLSDLCYADCDQSGSLDFFDFLCFQDAFAAGEPYADCDGSGAHDFFDFLCFQDEFAFGCP